MSLQPCRLNKKTKMNQSISWSISNYMIAFYRMIDWQQSTDNWQLTTNFVSTLFLYITKHNITIWTKRKKYTFLNWQIFFPYFWQVFFFKCWYFFQIAFRFFNITPENLLWRVGGISFIINHNNDQFINYMLYMKMHFLYLKIVPN